MSKNTFTKSELISGMLVMLRNGHLLRVFVNYRTVGSINVSTYSGFLAIQGGDNFYFSQYSDKLIASKHRDYDVIAIFSPTSLNALLSWDLGKYEKIASINDVHYSSELRLVTRQALETELGRRGLLNQKLCNMDKDDLIKEILSRGLEITIK